MTDIELLPLPEPDGFMESFDTQGCAIGSEDAWGEQTVTQAIRANVAHHTAKLQAEVEALRAEVLRLRTDNSESFRDAAILANIRRDEAEARADRLAEALRELCKHFPTDTDMEEAGWEGCDVDAACIAYDKARAALRDRDQEVGNG